MTRVVGLDLSLTGTGIARAVVYPSGWEVTTHLLGTPPAGDLLPARADRLTDLAAGIIDHCQGAHLVLIERPTFGAAGGAVTDRAGLYWLVVARLIRGLRVPVADVVNNHLKMYATGAGTGPRASKDAVLAETVRRYVSLVPDLSDNNEADALVLAAMGVHRLTGTPLVDLPQTHHRALAAVKWPALPDRSSTHGR